MPLHLLGKKSWNVYNRANIERVRRDEAEAAEREAVKEEAAREADAAQRMRLLRGEATKGDDGRNSSRFTESKAPEPALDRRSRSPAPREDAEGSQRKRELGKDWTYGDRDRMRKRRRGEDDTDRDMRYARKTVEEKLGRGDREEGQLRRGHGGEGDDDAPLVDRDGHIDLFPAERKKADRAAKRAQEDGKQSKRGREKDRELKVEDQIVMRLSDAAGYGKTQDEKAWYTSSGLPISDGGRAEVISRDVWGNEDPRRKERQEKRLNADDPLAAIKRGVQQVRKVEAERKKWKEERAAELRALKEEEQRRVRKRERHRRRREPDGEQSLEGFSLDADRSEDLEHGQERRNRRHHQLKDHHGSR